MSTGGGNRWGYVGTRDWQVTEDSYNRNCNCRLGLGWETDSLDSQDVSVAPHVLLS